MFLACIRSKFLPFLSPFFLLDFFFHHPHLFLSFFLSFFLVSPTHILLFYFMGSNDPIILIKIIIPPTMGSNKVKGLLKGLRYISQVFEEEKKQEIQIGAPTDVKHLAHIGCDGPSQESPSWMRGYGTPEQNQFTQSDISDGPDWVSEDSGQRKSRREHKEKLKTRHRRHRSVENALDSEGKEKVRQPRRHHTRAAEGRRARDESLPEVPKRTRKKKPKDDEGEESSRLSTSSKPDENTDKE